MTSKRINSANIVTTSRMVFAIAMLFATPFSVVFWLCYVCGCLSDMLDGFLARKLNVQSAAGAVLDSVADLVFAVAIAVVFLLNVPLPRWLWLCALGIALLRMTAYGIGYYKYHAFSALHTYANKATGLLFLLSPLLSVVIGLTATGVALCLVAFLATLEEMVITVRSKTLDRDRKSFLSVTKKSINTDNIQ